MPSCRATCRRRVVPLLVSVLLAAPLAASGDAALRRELRSRGVDPETVVFPSAIDERMIAWLDETIPTGLGEEERVELLLAQLVGHHELDLDYHRGYTATAIEVFESGKANCLAFTHLFVGLARHLDLPVVYVKVDDLQRFDREGDLVVMSGHVTAGYGSPERLRILEFSIIPASDYRRVSRLSDLSALALFYSNRGAETLLAGDTQGAIDWLETASRIDPELPGTWVNLGVAYRRAGRLPAAERSYWRALEVDDGYIPAYQNLSALLARISGREEEAQRLLELTDTEANRNPYNFLALGDLSLGKRRTADAERYYRRALALDPESGDVLAAMGMLEVNRQRWRRARKWLRKARKVEPQAERVERLAVAISNRRASG